VVKELLVTKTRETKKLRAAKQERAKRSAHDYDEQRATNGYERANRKHDSEIRRRTRGSSRQKCRVRPGRTASHMIGGHSILRARDIHTGKGPA
jgi:hypothetical protein